MGNVCSCYSNVDLPSMEEGRSSGRIQATKEQLTLSTSEDIDPAKVNVVQQLGQSAIDELLKEAQNALANDSVRNAKNRLVNEKFKLFNTDYTFWADFADLPSGNKLHIYHHQLEYPFTPEMYFLNSLQHTIESFSRVDDSLDQMDLLNFAAVDDLIVTVSRNKTKKILVVEPRTFLLVRVIKRISQDEIIEVQKAIQLTPLAEKEPWKTLIAKQVNLAEIKLGAVLLKRENGKTTVKSLANVDPLSSTGPMILKTLLKGKFSKFHKNTVKETLKFLAKAGEKEYSRYRWFSNDPVELTRILEENRRIVAANKPDLNDLDKLEVEEVKGLLEEKVAGRVSGGGVIGDHRPAAPEDSTRVFISGQPAQEPKVEEKPASRKQSEVKAEEKPVSRKQSEVKAEVKPASRKQSEVKVEEKPKESIKSESVPAQEETPVTEVEKIEDLPHKVENEAPKAPLSHFAKEPLNETIESETTQKLEPAKPVEPSQPIEHPQSEEQQQPEEQQKPELNESNATASTNVTESQIHAPESQPDTTSQPPKEEENTTAAQPEENEESKPKAGGKKNKKGRKGN